ncbi:MAG: DinB family protein [Acidobacteria bacterium]|nr:DinB family protein [Acidobacteriota bacterium]
MTLIDRLASIERKRLALLAEVTALDEALLTARPFPGKWSIREIIEHLVLAEDDVVGDFTRLDARAAQPRGFGNQARYLVVMFVLRFRIPVKAPSKAMLPTGDRSLAELRERWDEHHRRLRSFVAGLTRAGARRAIFKHPIAGPLGVSQAILMSDAHLDSHISQIRSRIQRLRAAETR